MTRGHETRTSERNRQKHTLAVGLLLVVLLQMLYPYLPRNFFRFHFLLTIINPLLNLESLVLLSFQLCADIVDGAYRQPLIAFIVVKPFTSCLTLA